MAGESGQDSSQVISNRWPWQQTVIKARVFLGLSTAAFVHDAYWGGCRFLKHGMVWEIVAGTYSGSGYVTLSMKTRFLCLMIMSLYIFTF